MKMHFSLAAIVTAAAICAGSPTAHAADRPVYSWTGFYIGGFAGAGWSSATDELGPSPYTPGLMATSVPIRASGSIFGAQAGYDIQSGQFVAGAVADIAYSHIRGTNIQLPPDPTSPFFTEAVHRLDSIGTIRGRVGFLPSDRMLVYVSGGYAYGQAKLKTTILERLGCGSNCLTGETSKFLDGWTVGGGLEHALPQGWSFVVEYLHYDLGRLNSQMLTPSGVVDFSPTATFKGDIVRAGVNYRFGDPRY